MSVLAQIKLNPDNIIPVLTKYKEIYKKADDQIKLNNGKSLMEANSMQPSLVSIYGELLCELNTLQAFMENTIKVKEAELYKEYRENVSYDYTQNEIKSLMFLDEKYKALRSLYLEVIEWKKKFENVKDAIGARGFALNNITKAMVAQIEQAIL
jgi:hypothetical protein